MAVPRAVALPCVLYSLTSGQCWHCLAWHNGILMCVRSSVWNHTQNTLYIARGGSFLNQDGYFCDQVHRELRNSVAVHRECTAQVVEGFVFPSGPALRWGLLDGYSWIQLHTAVMVMVWGILFILPQRRYPVSGGANAWAKGPFGHPPSLAQQAHGRVYRVFQLPCMRMVK